MAVVFYFITDDAFDAVAYDFREMAPAAASPEMFLRDGQYDADRHHRSHLAIGVPGTVAGLHLAWRDRGRLSWPRLVEPAIGLAAEGFTVTEELAPASLRDALPKLTNSPAALAQFTRNGQPYRAGELLVQSDLARNVARNRRARSRRILRGRGGGADRTRDDRAGWADDQG